jgi:peptidoglycan/xylan/chitin deacetylase (PgdA/CDA1 family)
MRTLRYFFVLVFYLALHILASASALNQPPGQDSQAINKNLVQPQDCNIPKIAISLDDAPMPGTPLFTGIEKTKAIIKQLQEVNSPPIGIFALGIHAQGKENLARLYLYGNAGHMIGNHTYHHYRLNDISSQVFIADIQKAHECFKTLPNFRPWFRFPYLCEGKDNTQRQEVIQALKQMGYQEGYVTISNHDYYINKLVVKAAKAGKKINYEQLKQIYLNILWSCIQTYHQLGQHVLKRNVKHVLLLHENDLAALFIGDLIQHIRAQGWEVISIEEAYQDPIADIDLMNNYNYSGRISAIAVEKGLGKGLIKFPNCTHRDYITQALQQDNLFIDP